MTATQTATDRWDWVLLILGLGGMGLSFLSAVIMAAIAALMLLESDTASAIFPAWTALTLVIVGALGIPAVFISARVLLGHPRQLPRPPGPLWILGLAILPVSLLLGYLAFETESLSGIFGPPAHLLAAGAPVLITVAIAIHHGPELSLRRRWGHFLAGLWAVPPITILVESAALIPLLVLLAVGLSISPEGQALMARLAEVASASEAELQALLEDFLSFPWIILAFGGYMSLAVPLIEEALKTMALWPLLRRRISSGEAFLAGVLGGAGYALFESLFIPQPGGGWLATMIARSGTPLIHALNTGLTCWGLSQAVHYKRWPRAILAYSGAVVLHGLWNIGAVGIGLASSFEVGIPAQTAVMLSMLGGGMLVAISLLSVGGLLWIPRRLKAENAEGD